MKKEQECIPVGCVPAARRPYAGVCFLGGGSAWSQVGLPGPGGDGGSPWSGGCLPGLGGSPWSGGCLPGPRGLLGPGGCLPGGVWHPSMH